VTLPIYKEINSRQAVLFGWGDRGLAFRFGDSRFLTMIYTCGLASTFAAYSRA
jgi:hypothetical protein